ncbi:hypothetical protein LS64_003140, partial [Helicobacter saguini]
MPKPFIERKNNVMLDARELERQGYTNMHFQGIELKGGIESSKENEECFFYGKYGEVYYLQDSKDSVIANAMKQSRRDSNNKGLNKENKVSNIDCHDFLQKSRNDKLDSKDSTQTLQVFLDSKVLTILNYSLLESSLNIKLESKSKEAKKILSKEL